jgi:hypothetical protein
MAQPLERQAWHFCPHLIPVVLALALVSCGGNPASDRLPSGSEVMLFDVNGAREVEVTVNQGIAVGDDWFPERRRLPVGQHVTVVRDEAADAGPGAREVTVNFREGACRGKSGRIPRYNLRPLR